MVKRGSQLLPWIPTKKLAVKWANDPSIFWHSPSWIPGLSITLSDGEKLAILYDQTCVLNYNCDTNRIRLRHLWLLFYDLLDRCNPEKGDSRKRVGKAECKVLAEVIILARPGRRTELEVVSTLQRWASHGLKYNKLARTFSAGISIVLPGDLDVYM